MFLQIFSLNSTSFLSSLNRVVSVMYCISESGENLKYFEVFFHFSSQVQLPSTLAVVVCDV